MILQSIDEKSKHRDEGLARAQAAGKNYGGSAVPHIDRMVQEIEKHDPGHRIAMRQAYDIAFRMVSPWEHTEAGSFKWGAQEQGDQIESFGDVSPFKLDDLRVIAGAMYA